MTDFKYTLDKRIAGHSPRKFQCPICNKKKFVRYISTETLEYLSDDLGRCDRETECGYFKMPEKESTVNTDFTTKSKQYAHTHARARAREEKPISYHDYEVVSASGRRFKENNFVQFLKSIFTDDEVKEAILKYLLGTSKHWNGATIFWQIDNFERVRSGKVLQYDPDTGKRKKNSEGKALINWVHSILKITDYNLVQCLFGLHLINETTTKTLAIVESEKTAVMMSVFKPAFIWLATGSKQGFKYEMLKPIKDYRIVAFPDKGEFDDWQKKATDLNDVGFKITVNDWIEKQDYPTGYDFADILIAESKYDLGTAVLKHDIIFTEAEHAAAALGQQNPVIWQLISTFDLEDEHGNNIRRFPP